MREYVYYYRKYKRFSIQELSPIINEIIVRYMKMFPETWTEKVQAFNEYRAVYDLLLEKRKASKSNNFIQKKHEEI